MQCISKRFVVYACAGCQLLMDVTKSLVQHCRERLQSAELSPSAFCCIVLPCHVDVIELADSTLSKSLGALYSRHHKSAYTLLHSCGLEH